MEARAIKRFERITPSKVMLILNEIRKKNVREVMDQLKFSNKRAAKIILKLLKSAVNNAKQDDAGLDEKDLYIKQAYADRGFILKRVVPRSRGMANRIRVYTSHITIVVTNEES
ncbi:MAG: 50S ribosomal protein L22 [Candidatus Hydrogenedentota bacterium]